MHAHGVHPSTRVAHAVCPQLRRGGEHVGWEWQFRQVELDETDRCGTGLIRTGADHECRAGGLTDISPSAAGGVQPRVGNGRQRTALLEHGAATQSNRMIA